VILSAAPTSTRADDLVVSETRTAGNGLFLAADRPRIEPREVLAEYPGGAEWVPEEDYHSIKPDDLTYVFVHGPVRCSSETNMYIVWNPCVSPLDTSCKACYANTSHPALGPPYTLNNCVWGLYFGDNYVNDTSTLPDVRLFIVACRMISPSEEILLDYHWQLALQSLISCGDLKCVGCYENCMLYMTWWGRYLHAPS
jgi:hypothetical protein